MKVGKGIPIDITDKQVARSLEQLKRQRALIKAHHTRAQNIALRKEWLEHQNRNNYQLEYDRIVGHINSGRTPGVSNEILQKKAEQYKKLGAKAVISINDMI